MGITRMADFFDAYIERYSRIIAGKAPTICFESAFPSIDKYIIKYILDVSNSSVMRTCDLQVQGIVLKYGQRRTYIIRLFSSFIPKDSYMDIDAVCDTVISYTNTFFSSMAEYMEYRHAIIPPGTEYLDYGRTMATLFPYHLDVLPVDSRVAPYTRVPNHVSNCVGSTAVKKLDTMLSALAMVKDQTIPRYGSNVIPLRVII